MKRIQKQKFWTVLYITLFVLLATACQTVEPSTADPGANELPEGSYLRVDYVDVGQADFIVVECDGVFMTIDGGNVADSQIVYSYLEERGITTIDTVVVTHAHEDHCGGVSAILNYAEVGQVYCPVTDFSTQAFKNVVKSVEAEGLEITVPVVGELFTIGNAHVQVLGPIRSSYDDTNDTSIVLRMTYGDNSFLFTGDAERLSEYDILNAGFNVSADVLKVGHHGSNSSTTYIWLKSVLPEYAVISSSRKEEPDYNHPHEEVVSRLRDADVTVYRTDLQGTITCYSDGRNITFTVEENPDVNTLYDAGEGRYNFD